MESPKFAKETGGQTSATPPKHISPGWATETLKSEGYLQRGSVTRLISQPLSDVFFGAPKLRKLELTYSKDAICQIPDHIILKVAKKEKEYFFYTQIAKWMKKPPIPECYFATQNADKSQAAFLLEDLSATHFQTEWPIPPIQALCEAAIDCLANVHAFWWDDPRLETKLRAKVTKGNFWAGRLDEAISQLPAFLEFIGDRTQFENPRLFCTGTSTFGICSFPVIAKHMPSASLTGIPGILAKAPTIWLICLVCIGIHLCGRALRKRC